jgi:hypothetical protein
MSVDMPAEPIDKTTVKYSLCRIATALEMIAGSLERMEQPKPVKPLFPPTVSVLPDRTYFDVISGPCPHCGGQLGLSVNHDELECRACHKITARTPRT